MGEEKEQYDSIHNNAYRRHYEQRQRQHRRKRILWGSAVVACLALVLVLITALTDIQLELRGDSELTLEYGQLYEEPGVEATVNGDSREPVIAGQVDETKLGSYTLRYRVRYLWLTKSAKRTVHIVDTTAPVIILRENPGHITMPGEEYVEEGYTATDNYDGDLTDKVNITREGDTITYTVKDSSGNTASVQRTILYGDVDAPVITLKGESSMTITAGSVFEEPGYSAVDNRDGDVTSKVQVTGTVDPMVAGEYVLTYTVTDAAGNTASVDRKVTVEPIKQPDIVDPEGKVIYLTFDDGPSKYTQQLLDVLEKYNAKATFFVVNTGYEMDTLLNNIVKGGHSIAIHSMSHRYDKIYQSESAFYEDLYGMQQIIQQYTGVTTTLMRFPGGSSNGISKKYCKGIMTALTQGVTAKGFQYFDWNVDSGDAGGAKSADEVYNNVIKGIGSKKTAIVLQHDLHDYSVEAVERIIIWGLQNGYTFQALTPTSPNAHHPVNN